MVSLLILWLWYYAIGYVIINVEGKYLEKFINICVKRNLMLFDILKKDNRIKLKLSIKSFKKLRPIAKKSKCRVKILKKSGLPFLLRRYRKRKVFALGLIISVFLFTVMNLFVWSVEVVGNENIKESEIIKILEKHGIRPGALKRNIDIDNSIEDILIENNIFAWIGITIRGTRVKVEVVESVQPPEIVPLDVPCNIIASKDGVVEKIVVERGSKIVEKGETIRKGQVVISGMIISENEENKYKFVHAMGSVKAFTWYMTRIKIDNIITDEIRTGNYVTINKINILGKTIKTTFRRNKFENFEVIEEKNEFRIPGDVALPFEIITETIYEKKIVEWEVDEEEARKIAEDTAYNKLISHIDINVEILDKKVRIVENKDGEKHVEVMIKCLEEVGVQQKIGGT